MLFKTLLLAGLLSTAAAAPLTASPAVILDAVEPRWGQKWLRTAECLPEDAERAGCVYGCVRYINSGVVCKDSARARQDRKEQMRSSSAAEPSVVAARGEEQPRFLWGSPRRGIQSVTPGSS